MALDETTEALMLAYVYGELSASDAKAFEARMDADAELRAEVEGLVATRDLLGQDAAFGARSGVDVPPPHLVDAIMNAEALARPAEIRQAALAKSATPSAPFTARLARWLLGGGVLAGAAAFLFVVTRSASEMAEPSIASADRAAPVAPMAGPPPGDAQAEAALEPPADPFDGLADAKLGKKVAADVDEKPRELMKAEEAPEPEAAAQGVAANVARDARADNGADKTADKIGTLAGGSAPAPVATSTGARPDGMAQAPAPPPPPAELSLAEAAPARPKADAPAPKADDVAKDSAFDPRAFADADEAPATMSTGGEKAKRAEAKPAPAPKKPAPAESRAAGPGAGDAGRAPEPAKPSVATREEVDARRRALSEKKSASAKGRGASAVEMERARTVELANIALMTGQRELARKNYLLALDEFTKAAELDPDGASLGATPVLGQMRSLVALKRPVDAVRVSRVLLRRDLKQVDVVLALVLGAETAERIGDLRNAREIYSRLLDAPAERSRARAALTRISEAEQPRRSMDAESAEAASEPAAASP